MELTFDSLVEEVTPSRLYSSLQHTIFCLDPDFKENPKTDIGLDAKRTAPSPTVQTDAETAPLSTSAPEQPSVIVSPTKKRAISDKSQTHVVQIPKKSHSPLNTWCIFVLVSRPFKSITERVAGLLVRQVHVLTLLCPGVLIALTSYSFIFFQKISCC